MEIILHVFLKMGKVFKVAFFVLVMAVAILFVAKAFILYCFETLADYRAKPHG